MTSSSKFALASYANRSKEFREAVQRVRKRQHELQEILKAEHEESGEEASDEQKPSGGVPSKKSKRDVDKFEYSGRSIIENISRLSRFLAENRSAYVDVLNNEWNPDPITDIDRDSIDEGANNFIRTANHLISVFKDDLKKEETSMSRQRMQHLESVTDILNEYLRHVTAIHSKQRAIRVEKELEIQKLARLEVDARRTAGSSKEGGASSDGEQATTLQRLLESQTSEEEFADLDDDQDTEDGEIDRSFRNKRRSKKTSSSTATASQSASQKGIPKTPSTASVLGYQYSSDDDNEQGHGLGGASTSAGADFSPEEIKAFEQENEDLYDDLMSLKDNVQQIQSRVVEITKLQEVFTEKVLEQKDNIDQIQSHAVATTENVRDGNEELRKAIQRNASIRVYILFFLIVMSFSLLFLDWYND